MHLRLQHLALIFAVIGVPVFAQTPPSAPTHVAPMAADAHPAYLVATIKPHDPNSPRQGFSARGDRFLIENQSVTSLLQFSYAIHPHQIVDAPEWLSKEIFDIDGKIDTEGEPNLRQMQEMIQKLLADRFQLKFHRDQRELSVYALRLAKGGAKLTPAAHPDAQPGQKARGSSNDLTQLYTSSTMADFILGMQFFIADRPIVDQTGLTGRYDITLHYTPDESRATEPNAAPGLFTAIQEQLGLKLEPVKAPADVFVLDHVEHPSAN